jgi:hypothetical protein
MMERIIMLVPKIKILARVKKEVSVEDILAETEVTEEEEKHINDIKLD